MSTIANRLRQIADWLNADSVQRDKSALRAIATELEAAAAEGAVPVVATVYRNGTGVFGYATMLERWEDGANALPVGSHRLVTEARHLSAIDHWQKRALEAEARIAWLGPVGASPAADHLSTIETLQAQIASLRAQAKRAEDVVEAAKDRIAELEALQVPDGWVIDIEGDTVRVVCPPDGPGFVTVVQFGGRLEQRILFALAKALAAPSKPTPT